MTALGSIEGALLVAWGSRLEMHRWTGSRLETTAFHDAAILVTSVSIIKRFVVYGDVHKSITFLQLSPDNRTFNNLSKVRERAVQSRACKEGGHPQPALPGAGLCQLRRPLHRVCDQRLEAGCGSG